MYKSTKVISPDYRKAPVSAVENFIGWMCVVAIALSVVFAAAGEVLFGSRMFIGAVIAYVAVILARDAR